MKFGRLVYRYTGRTYVDGKAIYNIGDNIQTFAVDHFYKRMGIAKEDIVDINFSEMKNYSGDYVILPMAGYASHYKRFNQLPTSDKIIPFFISFEMSDETCDDLIPYLLKHQPIGCRDEATMNLLRRKGVESYTSGCLTITLPRREREPKTNEGKVFFVDIPSKLKEYIPKDLFTNSEYIEHENELGHAPMTEQDRIKIDYQAMAVMEKYKNEARLVVTSRLHAAAPCIALGIPVIVTIDNIDGRFSWLDKLVKLYDSNHYHEIDWNPKPVQIETLKDNIFDIFVKKINKIINEKKDIYALSDFWEKRQKAQYDGKLRMRLKALESKYNKHSAFKYVIWGAGVHGRRAFTMMSEVFPNAQLVVIVDKYVEGTMLDVNIVSPDMIYEYEFDYVLISTHLGRFEAVESLTKMRLAKEHDFCFFISKDMPEELE